MQAEDAQQVRSGGASARTRRMPRRAALIVVVAACALGPGTSAAAAAPTAAPTPEPLWQAYPLESGGPISTTAAGDPETSTKVQGRSARSAATRRASSPAASDPAPAVPVLVALLAVAALAATAAMLVMRRRRAGADPALPGTAGTGARPPSPPVGPRRGAEPRRFGAGRAARTRGAAWEARPGPEPGPEPTRLLAWEPEPALEPESVAVTAASAAGDERCGIVWRPDSGGGQFRAMGTNRAGRRYVAARSPTVRDPRPPLREPETLAAYEALLARLRKNGWIPEPAGNGNGNGNGALWYAQSFHRRRPERQAAPDRSEARR
jgi:hypothetical protein